MTVRTLGLTLLGLLLPLFWNMLTKLWYDRKESMKEQGESLEGNACDSVFPFVPWLSRGLLSRVVASLEGGNLAVETRESISLECS